ncbi:RTA1 like protein-domain-containing protein [Chaetomium tenue]|uniref:RTA1 like protein-domain-containing protein n=1 Tax=Chaetomium tenue TaxID=1854479 RepID=A0ACB7PJG6_9PEZI|nr:RTA1 like protein-domain-containing protein [Chaetomium globosum]
MADEVVSIWPYNPSFPVTVLATALYGIILLAIFYLTIIKYRAWFFTTVVVGTAVEVLGYALRCYSIKQPTQVAPFAASHSLIVLAPILIAAGNYLLIGRLIRAVLDPERTRHRVLGIPARWLTRVFVCCDVVSCLVQASGSGLAAAQNWVGRMAEVGVGVLIGGLVLQTVAFAVFLGVLGRFWGMATGTGGELVRGDAPGGWRRVVGAVVVSSVLIMIRCIYRVAEFAEGMEGYSFNHEWLFWVFESAPMLIAIGVFCVFHPSAYLGPDGASYKVGEFGDSEGATELRTSYDSGHGLR